MLHVSSSTRLLLLPKLSSSSILTRWISSITPHNQIQTHTISNHNELLDFFDHILQQCTTIQQCKQVHTQIILSDTHQSAFLAAKIISRYSKFDLLDHARNVFDTTYEKCFSNLLLWNSILRANVTNGEFKESINLYRKMINFGVRPDGFTLPLIIRACGFLGDFNLCKIVHNHILQMGFEYNLHVVNELIGMYGKIGHMCDAYTLFDKMPLRNHISWNTVISGFSLNFDCDSAFRVFRRMENEGLEPNIVTWTALLSSHARCGLHERTFQLYCLMRERVIGASAEALAVVISACADLGSVEKGETIHGFIIKGGFESYLFVKNSLVCMYGKCGNINNALSLFSEMEYNNVVSWNALISCYADSGLCDEAFGTLLKMDKYTNIRPNVVSWSAVINGFASQGRGEECLEVFRFMQIANVKANSITISTVLSVCAELSGLNLGKEVHGHVIRALMDGNILVGNGLINMYTKCGSLEEGNWVFEKINGKDSISWNSMIAGYGMHGFGDIALKAFDQMIEHGYKPDGITFVAVLSACSHTGLVSEGRKLFDIMRKEFGIEPQVEHYACMVDLLGRAGFLKEASELVKEMPMEPNDCVWGAFLNACRIYRRMDICEETASGVFSLRSGAPGSYMLLSNMYAASGKWEESARVRKSAKTKGLKKTPGQSWIEVQKKVFMFSAGNAGKIWMDDIYWVLEVLGFQMEEEGCAPCKSFALQDVDEEEYAY